MNDKLSFAPVSVICSTTSTSKIKSYSDWKRIGGGLYNDYVEAGRQKTGVAYAAISITCSVVSTGLPAKNTGATHSHIGIHSQRIVKNAIKYIFRLCIRFG